MSTSDKRIAELLDRWLASVELHTRYLQLDDAAYARIQDWPRHQRPTKWVVELAHARLLELRRQLAERQARGDTGFAEGLELMSFLTTLLGSEHLERFIPLARPTAAKDGPARLSAAPSPVVRPTAAKPPPSVAPAAAATGQRTAARASRNSPTAAGPATAEVPEKLAATVVADAVRFMRWGREWPQLAGLIARLADRPAEQEIWKILRQHRAEIEAQARRPPD